MTVVKFGNPLTDAVLQPGVTFHIDAYGLAQAQATWAIDNSRIIDYIDISDASFLYPGSDLTGLNLRSYKYSFTKNKADVTMWTVDFAGIERVSGHTDAQINGVSTSSAQPIETHPNFTKVTDDTIGTPNTPIAGTPTNKYNNAIFNPVDNGSNELQYTFGGFGIETDTSKDPNKKAGVKSFLRPFQTFRGQMFFSPSKLSNVNNLLNTIGRTFYSDGDIAVLLKPLNSAKYKAEKCLLTAANLEIIGKPEVASMCSIKINYDIMYSPYAWDADIYGKGQNAIF